MTKPSTTTPWPTLKTYRPPHLHRIVLPVGGIGTGTVGFSGNGALRDWEIMNVPAKGFVPSLHGLRKAPTPSLILRCHREGETPWMKVLEGPLALADYEGDKGSPVPNSGLPRFRDAEFSTAYPFGQVRLRDRTSPLEVTLRAFNPLIPHDSANSSWPVAFFRVDLTNPGNRPVKASVAFTLPNFIGMDGGDVQPSELSRTPEPKGFSRNFNTLVRSGDIAGLFLQSRGVDPDHRAWGTLALSCRPSGEWSHRTNWADLSWNDTLLEYWEDLLKDGQLGEPSAASSHETPMASLCQATEVAPGATESLEFCLSWHFPNRAGWEYCGEQGDRRIGNHYTTRHADAWEVATAFWPELGKLEAATARFTNAVLTSDAPPEFREAALFNLSTLRTQTCFRGADGRFFAWEGIFDRKGSCFGSCNHVWNYEQALGGLFPDLAMSMHRTAFLEAMDERGMMTFRVPLPASGRRDAFPYAAADGQTGHIVRVFREWIGSGDSAFFSELWPAVRRALEFCWIPGGWDADRDGVMEGCQHNTMDVEYYGPNPQMTGWYLAALQAGAIMARHAGDDAFADECETLWKRGSAWVGENLFNGEYFEHRVVPPENPETIAPGLYHYGLPAAKVEPALQLGAGCLIDQLVGDCLGQLAGLRPVFDRRQARRTLRSILRYNRRTAFWEHFNHYRNYALGDEKAILMASYPRGNRPARPFPYFNEVMTGFEYIVALHLLLAGEEKAARRTVRDIRARFDGRKRNPYNEAECGHHYGRALAAWGLFSAWGGLFYNAVEGSLRVGREGRHFLSSPSGWGILSVEREGGIPFWNLEILGGSFSPKKVLLRDEPIERRPEDT